MACTVAHTRRSNRFPDIAVCLPLSALLEPPLAARARASSPPPPTFHPVCESRSAVYVLCVCIYAPPLLSLSLPRFSVSLLPVYILLQQLLRVCVCMARELSFAGRCGERASLEARSRGEKSFMSSTCVECRPTGGLVLILCCTCTPVVATTCAWQWLFFFCHCAKLTGVSLVEGVGEVHT